MVKKLTYRSSEVRWVKKQEALRMVTFPLTKKRLEIMLSEDKRIHCFGFKKEPFEIIEEQDFVVGNV